MVQWEDCEEKTASQAQWMCSLTSMGEWAMQGDS